MMPMSEIKTKAFILRTVQTQEADLIVKMITQNGEKISCYARAALKSKKRFEGGLQVLAQVEIRATHKNSKEFFQLEESKLKFEFPKLKYIHLYNLFGSALKNLDLGAKSYSIMTQFEVKLLSLMGWLPDLEQLKTVDVTTLKKILIQKMQSDLISPDESQSLDFMLKNYLKEHLGEDKMRSLKFLGALRRFEEQNVVADPKGSAHYN
jgi:recombinational DNA repair protein (RecF pathway)